ETTAADTLDGAEEDQLRHVLRETAERGADEEDDDRELVDALPAIQVGDLAPERRRGGRRQQVGSDDPRKVLQPAKVAGDPWQGDADDGLVQRREEGAGHDPEHDADDLFVGEVLWAVVMMAGIDRSGWCATCHDVTPDVV